jgi:hypothetical protein
MIVLLIEIMVHNRPVQLLKKAPFAKEQWGFFCKNFIALIGRWQA